MRRLQGTGGAAGSLGLVLGAGLGTRGQLRLGQGLALAVFQLGIDDDLALAGGLGGLDGGLLLVLVLPLGLGLDRRLALAADLLLRLAVVFFHDRLLAD